MTSDDRAALNQQLASLLPKCSRSDEKAFTDVYQLTSSHLFAVLVRSLGLNAVSEQALQDTYITIWSNAADYHSGAGQPIAWMTGIARSRATQFLHQQTSSEPIDGVTLPSQGEHTELAAVTFLDKDEQTQLLEVCLNELEEQPRDSIVRAYSEGLSHKQLAVLHDTTVSSIKRWVHRALLSLKECSAGPGHVVMDTPDKDWWTVHTGEYVLGLLDKDDRRVLDRIMQHESDVVRMVGQWNDWFQPLSNALTPIEPPDNLLPQIVDRLPKQTRRQTSAAVDDAAMPEYNQSGIDESASVMQLLRSNQQKTSGWRSFAGLIFAACLLLGLVYGAGAFT